MARAAGQPIAGKPAIERAAAAATARVRVAGAAVPVPGDAGRRCAGLAGRRPRPSRRYARRGPAAGSPVSAGRPAAQLPRLRVRRQAVQCQWSPASCAAGTGLGCRRDPAGQAPQQHGETGDGAERMTAADRGWSRPWNSSPMRSDGGNHGRDRWRKCLPVSAFRHGPVACGPSRPPGHDRSSRNSASHQAAASAGEASSRFLGRHCRSGSRSLARRVRAFPRLSERARHAASSPCSAEIRFLAAGWCCA